jgi:hypothetical protein
MAASSIALGGILLSLPRKMRKTSHQEQIECQNKQKCKSVYNQAHTCVATLVTEERLKEKENQRMAAQVINQVEGEFTAHGFGVTLSTTTINKYVRLNMTGMFPLIQGYKGLQPLHVFKLLVLAAKSFMQINQVNSIIVR